jgi:exopolysaccharide biosynthesis polyprenyl glycosylphosphotransferase
MRLIGFVDLQLPASTASLGDVPRLDDAHIVFAMIHRGEVDQVVIAISGSEEDKAALLVRKLADYPIEVRLALDLIYYRWPTCSLSPSNGIHFLHLLDGPFTGWRWAVKAAEDWILAFGALVVAALPMALIAIAIRLETSGPVFFRQKRIGFNNHAFEVLKFRTLHDEAAEHDILNQVTVGDPRVTKVGAFLRRTSLDELPQILNVLRGEMSFVGPRPHAPGTLAGGRPFEEIAARYPARHRVKPGLTGLAQVRGWRGPTDTEDKLVQRLISDLEYVENWSLWLDAKILIRTLVVVIRMRNAV